ncbi:MAG: ABC transporter permease [Deltaproteobacteria bacterium]
MRNAFIIARKELSIYFTTPTAYAVFCGMTFIAGMMFLAALGYFQSMSLQFLSYQQPQMLDHLNLTDMVVYPLLRNVGVIFLFMTPFLSMRLIADEKRTRTFELLMTAPIRPIEIMLGKYLAALGLIAVAVLLLGLFPAIVSFFGSSGTLMNAGGGSPVEWSTVASGLLGLFLVGAAMMAIGMFVSSLTESVVVSALVTFVILLVLWILNWQAGRMEGAARAVLDYLSMPTHLDAFAKGAPALKDLVYFATFMILGPFFTERAIEAHRWA